MTLRIGIAVMAAAVTIGSARTASADQLKVASADQLKVLTSNGIRPVLEELVPQFARQTTQDIEVVYGPSAGLKRQIDAGERFDIAILTPQLMDDLIQQGIVSAGSRTVVARSPMALAIRAGTMKPDIRTIDTLRQTLLKATSIAFAPEGAGGVFFMDLLPRIGLQGRLDGKFRQSGSGTEAAATVARGDAELGILPVSEILAMAGLEVAGMYPAEVQGQMVMVAGTSAATTRTAAVSEFIRFLTSPTVAPVFRQKGMEDNQGK